MSPAGAASGWLGDLVVPERLLARWHGRQSQVKQLVNWVLELDLRPGNLFLYGRASMGKTCILRYAENAGA